MTQSNVLQQCVSFCIHYPNATRHPKFACACHCGDIGTDNWVLVLRFGARSTVNGQRSMVNARARHRPDYQLSLEKCKSDPLWRDSFMQNPFICDSGSRELLIRGLRGKEIQQICRDIVTAITQTIITYRMGNRCLYCPLAILLVEDDFWRRMGKGTFSGGFGQFHYFVHTLNGNICKYFGVLQ